MGLHVDSLSFNACTTAPQCQSVFVTRGPAQVPSAWARGGRISCRFSTVFSRCQPCIEPGAQGYFAMVWSISLVLVWMWFRGSRRGFTRGGLILQLLIQDPMDGLSHLAQFERFHQQDTNSGVL